MPRSSTASPTTTATIDQPLNILSGMQRPEESSVFVIFGASGDLTKRKLIPALYNLACADLLPKDLAVIGFAVTEMDDEAFRNAMRDSVKTSPEANPFDPKVWNDFAGRIQYLTADFLSDDGYKRLHGKIEELANACGKPINRLYYLATPPSFYADIVGKLGKNQLVTKHPQVDDQWTRIIIEKPFGYDLATSVELNVAIHKVFREEQVYRIDHYLGKETVQNMMAFRFANSIIEPIWDRRYVDHVQITASETLGVMHRGAYYEGAGCLRDMFQNHLLQLLSIVAMEPPIRYSGSSVRDRKSDVLKSIVPINPENLSETAIRGQYGPGIVDELNQKGYRQEDGVKPDSITETFVALKLFVDSWRWADVPFYLRSGKCMARKVTEIVIQFKRVPHLFFHLTPEDQMEPNHLVIRIAPDEGIALRFGAKVPGPEMHIRQVQMNFSYSEAFKSEPETAYETLLLDAMVGDPTLFNRSDAVETAWSVLEPLLEIWHATKPFQPFPNYAAGTWGPAAADMLMARDGRAWRNPITIPSAFHQPSIHVENVGEPMGARGGRGGDGARKDDRSLA